MLIGVNALVWLAIHATGEATQPAHRLTWRCFPRGVASCPAAWDDRGGLRDRRWNLVAGVADGAWWQLVTSQFTHVAAVHIGLNMLALYFLGPMLENVLGRWRFLALYLVSGLAGSAAVMLFAEPAQPDPRRLRARSSG